MKFSIIIPVYNTEKFISRALDSVLSQDYKDFEIICIDDGSIDESAKIIKEKASIYPCIRYYYQKNQGPGIARKNGFLKATGDLIFFIDSDDYLIDNFAFSKIIDVYNKYNTDIVFFNIKLVSSNHEFISKPYIVEMLEDLHINANLYSKILRRTLLNEKMFIDSNSFEDFYTSYLYLDKCKSYYYLDEVFYCVYHGEDNDNHLSLVQNYEKKKKRLNIVNKTYLSISNDVIKSCIANYCSQIIVEEINVRTKNLIKLKNIKEDIIIKKEIKGIVRIINETNFRFNPNGKFKGIKKIMFKLFLIMHK